MPRLFGTDGIRGVPGTFPLDQDTVSRLGKALASFLNHWRLPLRILLAGDTRASTPILGAWFAGAFCKASGEVVWAGALPTPGVSHLLRAQPGFGAGVVISASHNPASDNGIKILRANGEKLSESEEEYLEALLADAEPTLEAHLPPETGRLRLDYLDLVKSTLPPGALRGLSLVVDAANGAASPIVGEFFVSLGAKVRVIHAEPNGENINWLSGALHPEKLVMAVREAGADAGVALDGDGDRAILVTHKGRVLTGDDVLLLWARSLNSQGQLAKGVVVATVMSNVALEVALGRENMRLVRCAVGDREVWETMNREGASLGGEQSGHIICSYHSVTGDGLLTAAHILAQGVEEGRCLEERADLVPFPQVLLGVKVRQRPPLEEVPALLETIRAVEAELGSQGRVLVRYSGTEMLLRVMVEAEHKASAQRLAQLIVQTAESVLA